VESKFTRIFVEHFATRAKIYTTWWKSKKIKSLIAYLEDSPVKGHVVKFCKQRWGPILASVGMISSEKRTYQLAGHPIDRLTRTCKRRNLFDLFLVFLEGKSPPCIGWLLLGEVAKEYALYTKPVTGGQRIDFVWCQTSKLSCQKSGRSRSLLRLKTGPGLTVSHCVRWNPGVVVPWCRYWC